MWISTQSVATKTPSEMIGQSYMDYMQKPEHCWGQNECTSLHQCSVDIFFQWPFTMIFSRLLKGYLMLLIESSSLVEAPDVLVCLHPRMQEHILWVSGGIVHLSRSWECRWCLNSDRLNSCSGLHQLCFSYSVPYHHSGVKSNLTPNYRPLLATWELSQR